MVWSGERNSPVTSTLKELREQSQLYIHTYFGDIPGSLLTAAIKRIPEMAEGDLNILRNTFVGTSLKNAIRAELGGVDWGEAVKRARRKLVSGDRDVHPALLEFLG